VALVGRAVGYEGHAEVIDALLIRHEARIAALADVGDVHLAQLAVGVLHPREAQTIDRHREGRGREVASDGPELLQGVGLGEVLPQLGALRQHEDAVVQRDLEVRTRAGLDILARARFAAAAALARARFAAAGPARGLVTARAAGLLRARLG